MLLPHEIVSTFLHNGEVNRMTGPAPCKNILKLLILETWNLLPRTSTSFGRRSGHWLRIGSMHIQFFQSLGVRWTFSKFETWRLHPFNTKALQHRTISKSTKRGSEHRFRKVHPGQTLWRWGWCPTKLGPIKYNVHVFKTLCNIKKIKDCHWSQVNKNMRCSAFNFQSALQVEHWTTGYCSQVASHHSTLPLTPAPIAQVHCDQR